MEEWFVPPNQRVLAHTIVSNYGYDQTGQVQYQFNQQGFRSPEFVPDRSVFFLGNSITFGIGLNRPASFADQVSQQINRPYGNLGLGCFYHENHDHLLNLTNLLARDQDDIFVIQINNLDRNRVNSNLVIANNNKKYCEQRFLDYFDQITTMLKYRQKLFLYWDEMEYNIPESIQKEFLIYNKFHFDQSLSDNASTFGAASHTAIAKTLSSKIRQFDQSCT